MLTRARKGLFAEYLVIVRLWCRGYRIVAHRFRCPVGEVDIIACRGDLWIFVEVKTLSAGRTLEQAMPSARQRGRITRTARLFMARKPKEMVRFDVVFVRRFITWIVIEDAW